MYWYPVQAVLALGTSTVTYSVQIFHREVHLHRGGTMSGYPAVQVTVTPVQNQNRPGKHTAPRPDPPKEVRFRQMGLSHARTDAQNMWKGGVGGGGDKSNEMASS